MFELRLEQMLLLLRLPKGCIIMCYGGHHLRKRYIIVLRNRMLEDIFNTS